MDTMTRPNLSAETIEELRQLNHAADPPAANLAAPLTDPRWSDDALCAQTDPDAFFPEKGGAPPPPPLTEVKLIRMGGGWRYALVAVLAAAAGVGATLLLSSSL